VGIEPNPDAETRSIGQDDLNNAPRWFGLLDEDPHGQKSGFGLIPLLKEGGLSGAGATVIVPARSAEKARTNLKGLERVELAARDLMNPESIDAFAKGFLASRRPIDLLINNAGIMACPLARDSRGNESQFSANHLGHFQLTLRLWPALVAAQGARVISDPDPRP